ncbi:Uncharacterized protein C11orf65-like protein [Trichoplax sp. H2]|nr:Uncharacterized protein C11orf65-like protein [Trichoplax sp. H2]|eukprot:RDD43624.1 Uncharacterized protein C11orf65-like protein [Trichoplax sp. H2]
MISRNIVRKIIQEVDFNGRTGSEGSHLAAVSKSQRRKYLNGKNGPKLQRVAAAIEIQRAWRGYQLRCKWFAALNIRLSMIANSTYSRSAHSRLADLESLVSASTTSEGSKTSARLRLEIYYNWFQEEHSKSNIETFENFCAMIIQQWWRNKHGYDKTGRYIEDDDRSSVTGSSYSYSYSSYSESASRRSRHTHTSSHYDKNSPSDEIKGSTTVPSKSRSRSPSVVIKGSTTIRSKGHSNRSSRKPSPAPFLCDKQASYSTTTSPDPSISPDRRSSNYNYQPVQPVVIRTKPVRTMLVEDACEIIQRAWRSYLDRRVYRYYRKLISFKLSGDPAKLLRCINPQESKLLDAASGSHVKFRLGGETFPPTIYYKIYTHRNVADICSTAPRDYTKMANRKLTAKQANNRNAIIQRDDKRGWYRRHENNGWRSISEKPFQHFTGDDITYTTSQKQVNFSHTKLLRRQDLERKKKLKKLEWFHKMYNQGKQALEETLEGGDIEDSLDVEELIRWTNNLNYDQYLNDWQIAATSGPSDKNAILS